MSLRTYQIISHPAFLEFIEGRPREARQLQLITSEVQSETRPQFESIFALAGYLQVAPREIGNLITRKSKHYRAFPIHKRSGGVRIINAPRTFMKVVQWWILDTILAPIAQPDWVHGFVPGKSFVTNARIHIGARHVLNVDVKDFFDSLSLLKVQGLFAELGYSEKVALDLSELVTLHGRLPQGAPTSPVISNLLMRTADNKIVELANQMGVTYTRYADDLTFSSRTKIPSEMVNGIKAILVHDGLELNQSKTKFMGPNQIKEVTGLRLGANDVALYRSYLNGVRGWFHRLSAQPEVDPRIRERVAGTLNLLSHVGGAGTAPLIADGHQTLLRLDTAIREVGKPT